MEIRAAVQDHSRSRISIGWNKLYSRGMKSLGWLEVPKVPWSQLGGAVSLKGHEMTPWVKDQSYIMAVHTYSGGLGSFRPHKWLVATLAVQVHDSDAWF
jgi:hypothetical protein